MSDSNSSSRRHNIFEKHISGRWMVLGGNCEVVNDHLEDKPMTSIWVLLFFLNSVLRSFGQVIFANNPISGLLILVAVGVASYKAMLAAILTSSLGFIFATVLQQDFSANINGIYGCNPVLHAIVSVELLPLLYNNINIIEPKFWFFLILITLISIYVTSGMINIFQHWGKYPVPCFTLPFNVLQFILIFCLLHNSMPSEILSNHLIESPENRQLKLNDTSTFEIAAPIGNESLKVNVTENFFTDETRTLHHKKRRVHERRHNLQNETSIRSPRSLLELITEKNLSRENSSHFSWGKTFSGTVVALSQVYGLNNIPCAALMYLALVIYSPITAGFTYIGAVLGTLFGTFFAEDPEEIYNGIWAYNGLLCAGGLAGFGFVLTLQSTFLSFVAVIFSTLLQHFMTPWFRAHQLPVLTMPFNITTIFFLYVNSGSEKALVRPSEITFPEKHLQEFRNSKKERFQGYLRRARLGEIFSKKDDV